MPHRATPRKALTSMAEGMIIQFGTSRFLQAHFDFFAEEARLGGQSVPPIVVVQSSGASARRGRVPALSAPAGYPVEIRGIEAGAPVSRTFQVHSISKGFCLPDDWDSLCQLFVQNAGWVVSNTSDAGYIVAPEEIVDLKGASPAPSFPGKLAQLLHMRYAAGGSPPVMLPCELISRNGEILRALICEIAQRSGAEPGFFPWIESAIFTNSLVDRIVSEAIEPAGAIAEPYALWAIEATPGLQLPFTHPDIRVVHDLELFERLKLHILNLGHTVLADIWLTENRPARETVRAILTDHAVRAKLESVYHDEIMPGFAAHDLADEAKAYIDITMERFLNPFLDHHIADIAENHLIKIKRRIDAFMSWAQTPAPLLARIAAQRELSP